MKFAAYAFVTLCIGLIGCTVSSGRSPGVMPGDRTATRQASPLLQFFTPTPAPGHLYVDHNGTFSVYALPLSRSSKPQRTLLEAPGTILPPQIAGDLFGSVAIASPTEIDLFRAPIRSFARNRAYLEIPLTPAITQIGPSGADLADIEFDPSLNLWLLNNYGGGQVTELQAPLHKYSVAAATVLFGIPGTKAGPYGSLRSARFDVGSSLYVYATQPQGQFSLLFKNGFPYASAPSPVDGLDLAIPDFVDPSQYPNGPPPQIAAGVLIGQYTGLLASPAPGKSPPPPVQRLAEFNLPLMPVNGVFPAAVVNDVSGALVADPARAVFYSLSAADGTLKVYGIPLGNGAKPHFVLQCAAKTAALCNGRPEHLFLAP
ncbi:MAG TPA: hypothetical protein VK760_15095 [Candidatus Acidoferrales bacterium]|jgi:hypothetical protein|nr:hypothetical protein [Candidatus Acidoferrales bacterium]